MDKEDKRGIFFGVIGVLTLIVAIVGASLAYFSINAESNPNALQVQAGTVEIDYIDGQLLQLKDLIPSSKATALETLRRGLKKDTYTGPEETQIPYMPCVDDKGYNVCGVYEFTIENKSKKAVIANANIVPTVTDEQTPSEPLPTENGQETPTPETPTLVKFSNLMYELYDVTNVPDDLSQAETVMGNSLNEGKILYESVKIGDNIIDIPATTKKKYRLFVWLNDTGENQNFEQSATYSGKITIDVSGAGSGQISGDASNTLPPIQ